MFQSLQHRFPGLIDPQAGAFDIAKTIVAELKQKPDPYGTWNRVLQLYDIGGAAANMARAAMVTRINDVPFVRWLCAQKWFTADVSLPFVTSDRPLLINLDGQMPVHILRFAISPSRLLVIHPARWRLDDDLLKLLVISYNVQVIENAWEVVVSDRDLIGVTKPINYPLVLESALKRRRLSCRAHLTQAGHHRTALQ